MMFLCFDDYLFASSYLLFFAFGKMFFDLDEAVDFSLTQLGRRGTVVEVECAFVPDCACRRCGEHLFDWQTKIGEGVGTSGSDFCFFSLADGLICSSCAKEEARLEVSCVTCSGRELGEML